MSATAPSRDVPRRVGTLSSPEATSDFAAALAPMLIAGDVVTLSGPIGAGKTHLARALVQARLGALGLFEDVPSPTFTLVQTYEAGPVEIWHADLYRLRTADEIAELGLDQAFDTSICLVEWPDRLGDAAPDEVLALDLSHTRHEGERHLTLTATGARWQARWDAIAALLDA